MYKVTCKAQTPPALTNGCFGNGTPIASCTLKVPSGKKNAYQTVEVWKDFGTIEGGGRDSVTGKRLGGKP